jgi:DNA gyrase subunit A
MQYVKAPDFPTACTIYGYDGVREAFLTGRGRVIMRGEVTTEVEEHSHGKERIVITSIPYQVNKSEMVRRIADLVKEGKIEGVAEIRDESKRDIRVVLELKRDAITNVIINKLYQHSPLQTSFGVNNVALVHGRPKTLNLKDLMVYFVEHRHEVIVRRSQFELRKAEERLHIVAGLIKALDIIDEIISLIRASKTVDEAKNGLIEKWQFSEIQASAIVEMRLRQLTGLERERLQNEYDELCKRIDYLKRLLANEAMRMQVIKDELLEVKEKYGDKRISKIEYAATDFRIEDTIADENMIITISHLGYIKRTSLNEYRVQNRGGKGSKGSEARDTDFIEHLYTATNHNYLLFFTEKGKCFWLRVFEIPEGGRTAKGRPIQNLINIESGDKVRAVINVKNLSDDNYINNNYIVLCSEKGIVKKTSLKAYSRPRQNGINAITIREGDTLLEARLTDGHSVIMMALHSGKAIRFNEKHVRPMGRNASGVRGIRLADNGDRVVGMICVSDENNEDILVVSENGYGKRSSLDDYRETNRGGKGVKTISITDKTGHLITIKNVTDFDDLMIINRSGIVIRLKVSNLRVMGRATQGVRLIDLKGNDIIAAVTQVPTEENAEDTDLETGINVSSQEEDAISVSENIVIED